MSEWNIIYYLCCVEKDLGHDFKDTLVMHLAISPRNEMKKYKYIKIEPTIVCRD